MKEQVIFGLKVAAGAAVGWFAIEGLWALGEIVSNVILSSE